MSLEMGDNFAKYLEGEPLNEELAELRSGEKTVKRDGLQIQAVQKAGRRALTRKEKAALRDFRSGEAWPAVTALVKNAVQRREDAATMLSQDDPLGNASQIAAQWGYVKMFKELWLELVLGIETAAATVEKEEKEDVQ